LGPREPGGHAGQRRPLDGGARPEFDCRLFLGLGRIRGMDAACLMGETSGYLVDPKAAKSVLGVLSELLDVEVDLGELEKKAEELEEFVSQMMQQMPDEASAASGREDLRYIG